MSKSAGRQYEPNKSRQGGLKHQITKKSQTPIFNDQNGKLGTILSTHKPQSADDMPSNLPAGKHYFGILNLGHWNLFGIWFFVLGIFHDCIGWLNFEKPNI